MYAEEVSFIIVYSRRMTFTIMNVDKLLLTIPQTYWRVIVYEFKYIQKLTTFSFSFSLYLSLSLSFFYLKIMDEKSVAGSNVNDASTL